jgi:hypothetical protein
MRTGLATRRNWAVAAYAADLARQEAAEAARAAELVREFVAAARERPVVRRPRPVPDEAARLAPHTGPSP